MDLVVAVVGSVGLPMEEAMADMDMEIGAGVVGVGVALACKVELRRC